MKEIKEIKLNIGNKGWTGKTVHAIRENGLNLCYRLETTVRPTTNFKEVLATEENVTCKHCKKQIAWYKENNYKIVA